MANEHQSYQLLFLLDKLKLELKKAKLSSEKMPATAALQSFVPFCCDTLTLEQWLQFIFIEWLSTLVINEQSLPGNIAITPMAENVYKCKEQLVVLDIIADVDELLSGQLIQRAWRGKMKMTEKSFIS